MLIAEQGGAVVGTCALLHVDDVTLEYLRQTGRDEAEIQLVEAYCKANQLFRTDDAPEPEFTKTVELDLSTVVPSLAGPKRPQDRVPLTEMKGSFNTSLTTEVGPQGFGLAPEALPVADVIVTLGSKGCRWHGAEGARDFPAIPVTPVDTTGAGDTFTGYVIAGLDRGLPMPQAISQATRAAAIMVTRHGTADVIPDLKDVQDATF